MTKVELFVQAIDVDQGLTFHSDFYLWQPEPSSDFSFLLTLTIGDRNEPGTYYYSLGVLSKGQTKEVKKLYGKQLILKKLDKNEIIEFVDQVLENCNASDSPWEEIRKHFDWEYEGFDGVLS